MVVPGNAQAIGARIEQQDAFGFTDKDNAELMERCGVLGVVADGMGGLALGRQASQLAVETILNAYTAKSQDESISDALHRALQEANTAVLDLAKEEGLQGKVGTTAVAAVVREGLLYWVSVGDSRLYLYRRGKLLQMTQDHVYAIELARAVERGVISKKEAETHPERRSLTSHLGVASLDEVDCNAEPFALLAGDRLLLCSDGLYGSLSENEIAAVLRKTPGQVAEMLIQSALTKQQPHQDNLTAVIMAWEPEERFLQSRPLRWLATAFRQ